MHRFKSKVNIIIPEHFCKNSINEKLHAIQTKQNTKLNGMKMRLKLEYKYFSVLITLNGENS